MRKAFDPGTFVASRDAARQTRFSSGSNRARVPQSRRAVLNTEDRSSPNAMAIYCQTRAGTRASTSPTATMAVFRARVSGATGNARAAKRTTCRILPRPWRLFAAWATLLWQVLIVATSNHNFFNLLTIVLCLFLFDDRVVVRVLPAGPARHAADTSPAHNERLRCARKRTIPFGGCARWFEPNCLARTCVVGGGGARWQNLCEHGRFSLPALFSPFLCCAFPS